MLYPQTEILVAKEQQIGAKYLELCIEVVLLNQVEHDCLEFGSMIRIK